MKSKQKIHFIFPIYVTYEKYSTNRFIREKIAKQLIEKEKVALVFGGLDSPVSLAMLPVFHELETPYMGVWAAATGITRNGNDPNYAFRVSANDNIVDSYLLRYAKNELGATKVGLVLINNPWGESNQVGFEEWAPKYDMEIVGIEKFNDGLSLFYVEKGRGDPIIFVPGFTFSHEVFEKQLSTLSALHKVIVIDPRSHGRSAKTVDGNNYPQHGRDLEALFSRLNVRNATLVGWSFGALSAWSYVEQFGLSRIKKFVCIDMPPVPISADENAGAWVEGPIADLASGYHSNLTPDGQREFMAGYAQQIMVQRELSNKELNWITGLSLRTPSGAVKDLFASGLFSNYLETAKMIDAKIPNMYFLAEHWSDVAIPYIEKEFPNAITITLGGHMMFWEHPAQFDEALCSFLSA